jgi:hypothetical protein
MAASPSYLPVIRTITNVDGGSFAPTDEMRILAPLTGEVVTGDGPDRFQLGVASGVLTSLTGTAPIAVSAGLDPVVSIAAATTSLPGSMSAADKTKLDSVGTGAVVTNVGVSGALTLGGTGAFPIVGIPAASAIVAGSMSTAHYSLVNGATAANTASTIMRRDVNGDFVANVGAFTTVIVDSGGIVAAGSISLTPFVETYAATIEMRGRDGGRHEVTLTGNVFFDAPITFDDGASFEVFITQGGAGSYTASWDTGTGGFYFPFGLTGVLMASVVGDCDYFEFKHRAAPVSHWVCVAHLKYSPP